jgi:hypothetical protein
MVYENLRVYSGSLGLNDAVGVPVEVGDSGHYERAVRVDGGMCRNGKKETKRGSGG